MMPNSVAAKNSFSVTATEEALVEVSKLLSRLARSRKAGMRLKEITELTGVVARLSRSLQLQGTEHGEGHDNDGYGCPDHYSKISQRSKVSNLIR